MTKVLQHRGPDHQGVWVDAAAGIALGHRRLSILDLSKHGRQPMMTRCGRFVITFNGEIYNYREIRTTLEKQDPNIEWRGASDTEVMLEAITRWGVRRALPIFNGMFAFALWDRRQQVLYLVRDRLGEKPIYYGWQGDFFLFGSELKALREHDKWNAEIDRNSLSLFMSYGYVPAPYTIHRDIFKLQPGKLAVLALGEIRNKRVVHKEEVETYWSAKKVVEHGILNSFSGSDSEAVEQLDKLVQSAVELRMESDVPLGAFLSGGVDSSLVVAMSQACSLKPIRSFSIGFHEKGYNEATHARAVAKHLGTEHTELYVTSQEAISVIPDLPRLYDEPFADSSQIPTYLIAKLTREHVTVALSGDGGDELFAGYNRYFWGQRIWKQLSRMPLEVRRLLSRGITTISPSSWDSIFGALAYVSPRKAHQNAAGDKLHKLARVLAVESPYALYRGLVSTWAVDDGVVIGAKESITPVTDPEQWIKTENISEWMMFVDTLMYLPDDILTKVDRATMGVGLETRVPLLDHRLFEFAWSIPLSTRMRNGKGKWLLKQVLSRYVPMHFVERQKMGFGVPIDTWLRGPLREWAESLLNEDELIRDGFFDAKLIRTRWREHLSGARNWQYHLWNVLMFQEWFRGYKSKQ